MAAWDSDRAVADTLAGVAAVLHRRTGQDQVRILYRDLRTNDEVCGALSVEVGDDPAISVLAERAQAELSMFVPEPEDAIDVTQLSAVVEHGDGAGRAVPRIPVLRVLDGGRSFTVSGSGGEAFAAQVRRAVAADPACPLSDLDLMSADERARVSALAGNGHAALPARCVHELVAEQAARTPDAVAISSGSYTVTYRQLDGWADGLAAELRAAGVGHGSVVAVLQHRSPELIVVLLAVLKAGGAYLALDPEDPPGRYQRLMANAGVRLLLVQEDLRSPLPDGVTVLTVPRGHGTPPARAQRPAGHGVGPDSPAYVCYTSGSTGEPRGVVVPHRAIARLVRAPSWIDIRQQDVFLQLAPVAFDASTFEIWTPLVNGCRLAVFRHSPLDLAEIEMTLAVEQVSVLWLTAGLFHQMVASRLGAFGGLRHVIAGGDVISPAHLDRLVAAHPRLTFTNGYGPTENTTFTTCWTTRTAAAAQRVPIGRPIDGTSVAVLDARMRPVPTGVRGELWASGDGVAVGYVDSPAATAERFLPDPFATEPGRRMYRTGDIVRWAEDGTLEFLGRADQQVKVRGFRVEPGSVEAELVRHPDVRQAVVVAQRQPAWDTRLIAYIDAPGVPPERWHELSVRLREHLRGNLPAYLVPWAIIVRRELPLTANGKVDRRALPATTRVPRNVWNDYVMPRDSLEHHLAELWGESLGVEPVGVEDDFFDLGGHSLLAAELVGLLQQEFQLNVPARTIYLQPTISELAAQLIELSAADR